MQLTGAVIQDTQPPRATGTNVDVADGAQPVTPRGSAATGYSRVAARQSNTQPTSATTASGNSGRAKRKP